VNRLLSAETFKRFMLARLEWLIRGWCFAAGCWFTVGLAWLMQNAPELAVSLIERVQP
jgi:hypothetical protein